MNIKTIILTKIVGFPFICILMILATRVSSPHHFYHGSGRFWISAVWISAIICLGGVIFSFRLAKSPIKIAVLWCTTLPVIIYLTMANILPYYGGPVDLLPFVFVSVLIGGTAITTASMDPLIKLDSDSSPESM